MGGPVQEVLQRRGGKEGHGIGVKRVLRRVLVSSPLVILSLGILFGAPVLEGSRFSIPAVYGWFFLSLSSTIFYCYTSFLRREKRYLRKVGDGYLVQTLSARPGDEREERYLFEALLSFPVLTAGVIHVLGLPWLHVLYIPLLCGLSLLYGWKIMVPLSLAVPVLETRHLVYGDRLGEAVFSGSAVLVAVTISVVVSAIRKERNALRKSIETLKGEARDIDAGADTEIIRGDNLVSQHLASTKKANEEIEEVLKLARHSISADAVSLFDLKDRELSLRCFTGERREALSDARAFQAYAGRRASVILEPPSGGGDGDVHVLTPVAEGTMIVGVLTARKRGTSGDGRFEVQVMEMCARQIVKILHNQRVRAQMNKEHSELNILHMGSTGLATSLKTEETAQRIVEAAHKITPFAAALFIPKGRDFELAFEIEFSKVFSLTGRTFDFSSCRVGMAGEGAGPLYISDVKVEMMDSPVPIFPAEFKGESEGSVLVLPLSYKRELHGVLVLYAGKPNALSSSQIWILELLGDQAAASLANAKLHERIERMAVTDGLTGLYNHRHFQEKLAEEFMRMERFRSPLSFLLIDIDFFKKVNDTHGHPAGDEILRGVAGTIRETVRNVDIPARYGGEEFAVILPGTNHEGARIMAERLRTAVSKKKFSLEGREAHVTVSIGAATSPYDTDGKDELIERADQALYYAKRNGRDRCAFWREVSR